MLLLHDRSYSHLDRDRMLDGLFLVDASHLVAAGNDVARAARNDDTHRAALPSRA